MNVKINVTHAFKRQAKPLLKKYVSLAQELQALEQELLNNPKTGTLVRENIYKIRLAVSSKGKGKSGGLRVITYLEIDVEIEEEKYTIVNLIAIYDKSEVADLPDSYIGQLIDDLE
jgi:mRNA-degrading endonuclease RelE of RelBE toxin-antitoxin system